MTIRGALLAVVVLASACSVIDATKGRGDTFNCDNNTQICDFCAQLGTNSGCETVNCATHFDCVRGLSEKCGQEFEQMLNHFVSKPSDCFDPAITEVKTFLTCEGTDSQGAMCFPRPSIQ